MSHTDPELFELCKEVHKRTKWDDETLTNSWKRLISHDMKQWRDWFIAGYNNHTNDFSEKTVPLYTSDYLLEKLPSHLNENNETYYLTLEKMNDQSYTASYGYVDIGQVDHPKIKPEIADTPLAALLKLTIKLHENGEII